MKERITELTERRQRWLKANEENNFQEGIGNLLTQLYPDNAHFIYELLQNAEDAEASTLEFDLESDKLIFKHDGKRLFRYEDIDSITAIGNSTKHNDPTNIGKFGVGFKAVFAYTQTPIIKSGSIEFRISQLVLPELIQYKEGVNTCETRFTFPFNNPKKEVKSSFNEILKGLRELTSTSLLFLENIKRINILLDGEVIKTIERTNLDEHLIRVKINNQEENWLLLNKKVTIQEKQLRISIAFGYDAENKRIVPVDDGRVNIYFPCEKESSNLKFHIHAPFASTVARDSVRDTKENEALIAAIADLAAESMFIIRDKELLKTSFLSVLPNSQDNIPSFYKIIEDEIKKTFKTADLVPMQNGQYAAANGVFIGYKDVRTLFNDDDFATLLNVDKKNKYLPPMWVKGYSNETRRDCFLNDLGVNIWSLKDFLIFVSKNECSSFFDLKDANWFRKLYAHLNEKNLVTQNYGFHFYNSNRLFAANSLPIVKLKNGGYEIGENCYFQTKNYGNQNDFLFVDEKTYSYSPEAKKEKEEAEAARKFLTSLGVKMVNEEELICKILENRYNEQDFSPRKEEILRFVRYFKKYGNNVNFEDYFIFMTSDGKWAQGEELYIDYPFYETGLGEFYNALGDKATRYSLSQDYLSMDGLKQNDFIEFLLACNAIDKLHIKEISCKSLDNFNADLRNPYYGIGSTEIDKNYTIEGLSYILSNQKITQNISRLIWNLLNDLTFTTYTNFFRASYRPNQQASIKETNSTFLRLVKDNKWVPQVQAENGKITFFKPEDASFDLLPKDFTIIKDKKWLEAVDFGKALDQKQKEQAKTEAEKKREEDFVNNLGFTNRDEAKKTAEWLKKQKAKGVKIEDLLEEEEPEPAMYKDEPYTERRAEQIRKQHEQAPVKNPQPTTRTIDPPPIDAREYLEGHYKELNNKVRCQLCRSYMPFKLRSGKDYFEKVEALSFETWHESHYLALCPTCSALYKEHVKLSPAILSIVRKRLLDEGNTPIELKLDQKIYKLSFTSKHRGDIREKILKND